MASGIPLPAAGALTMRVQGGDNVAFLDPLAGVTPPAAQEQDKAGELEPKWIKEREKFPQQVRHTSSAEIALRVN